MHVALEDELGLIVERRERLVEQQDVRIGGKRADERHALPHAAGELIGIGVLEAAEAVGFQQLVRLPARLGGALAQDFEAELGVLQHGAPLEQVVLLQQNADALVGAANARAVEQDLAFRRLRAIRK